MEKAEDKNKESEDERKVKQERDEELRKLVKKLKDQFYWDYFE